MNTYSTTSNFFIRVSSLAMFASFVRNMLVDSRNFEAQSWIWKPDKNTEGFKKHLKKINYWHRFCRSNTWRWVPI